MGSLSWLQVLGTIARGSFPFSLLRQRYVVVSRLLRRTSPVLFFRRMKDSRRLRLCGEIAAPSCTCLPSLGFRPGVHWPLTSHGCVVLSGERHNSRQSHAVQNSGGGLSSGDNPRVWCLPSSCTLRVHSCYGCILHKDRFLTSCLIPEATRYCSGKGGMSQMRTTSWDLAPRCLWANQVSQFLAVQCQGCIGSPVWKVSCELSLSSQAFPNVCLLRRPPRNGPFPAKMS